MKTWKIPVTWEMCGIVIVKAATLAEAMEEARINDSYPEFEDEGSFVDGSWDLSMHEEDSIREIYNENQPDEEAH